MKFKCSFEKHDTSFIPEKLDPRIEATFSQKQQDLRQSLFDHLVNKIDKIDKVDDVEFVHQSSFKKRKSHNSHENKGLYRGSKYIGVAKNGRAWQAQTTIDQEYAYLGNHTSEQNAAEFYDVAVIQAKGLQAKSRLNFEYSVLHLLAILTSKSVVEVKREFDRKLIMTD